MSDFTEKVRAMLDKATKEPWEAGDESDSHYDVCIGETTCSLDRANPYTGKYVISREEMTANAHLIIASPTLLREACERIERRDKVIEALRNHRDRYGSAWDDVNAVLSALDAKEQDAPATTDENATSGGRG